jgi:hypothetical protein
MVLYLENRFAKFTRRFLTENISIIRLAFLNKAKQNESLKCEKKHFYSVIRSLQKF